MYRTCCRAGAEESLPAGFYGEDLAQGEAFFEGER